jgi:hypothetical protein
LPPLVTRRLVLILCVALLLMSACQRGGSGTGCGNVAIDWVDFIQVGSTQYVAGLDSAPAVTDADLGPVFAHTSFKLEGNVCDPHYQPKDGDAAFLEPGTPIYAVTGQPTSKLLAARRDGHVIAYRARGI